MNCTACGKELGLWAKLSGQSGTGVCKACHEQALSRLGVLARSAACAPNWNHQFAEGWLNQFEEIVRKFSVPNPEASPLRFLLLNNIMGLVESKIEIPDSDLKFVLELARKYSITQSSPEEIKNTIFRIGMREAIQNWERGELPTANCSGMILQKGEVCRWEEGAALRIQRVQRHYEGAFGSVSVPVGLVKGMRVRVGGFKGYPVDETVFENGGAGVLHITNKRACFVGQQHSAAIPYKKMISLQGFETGFTIQTSNEKKPGIFIVRYPELTVHLVNLASSGPGEDEPPKKRRQKLPATA
jgi:hypothetical protein